MVNDMIMSVPIKALLLLLPATNLMYYFKDYEMKKISVLLTMLLLSIIFAHAQQISIKGIVIDKKLNEPITVPVYWFKEPQSELSLTSKATFL